MWPQGELPRAAASASFPRMTLSICIQSPLLAGLARFFENHGRIVQRSAFASDAEMAKAEPDIAALVVIGGEKLEHALVESLPKLKLVACFGAGYDGVDVAHAAARGIAVTNCPNVNNEDVADFAMGLMLALVRDITGGERRLLSGGWSLGDRGGMRPSIRQLRFGILGFGAIGQSIARRLPGFGVSQISWWGPNPKPDAHLPRAASVVALAEASDVLFVACRADETTRRIVNADVLSALGQSGYLINVSRGFTVDEDALIAALKENRIAGAALDVYEEEPAPPARWKDVPNTVLTPHVAGGARGAAFAQIQLVSENLALFAAGKALKTPVQA